MEKIIEELMKGDKPDLFKLLLPQLKDMEVNIKCHGIVKDKKGIERLWISVTPIEQEEIPIAKEEKKAEATEEQKEAEKQ